MHQKRQIQPRSTGSEALRGNGQPRATVFSSREDEKKSGKELSKKQILRRAQWFERHLSMIPPNPEDPICDPGNSIQKVGIKPKEFWYWYHIHDGPDVSSTAPWVSKMGRVWGELWFDYLVVDELVLSGAIPLILQKRSQMTGKDEERTIRMSEVRALQTLQKRIGELHSAAKRGGLVISICGRVQIAIFQREYDVAQVHLRIVRKLFEFHEPSRAEWLCAVWSDLRVASTLGSEPVLLRHVAAEWKHTPTPGQNEGRFQRLAMQNVRALNHVIGEEFALIFALFRRLHGLQDLPQIGDIPIESYYHGTYDCCVLHAKVQPVEERPDAMAVQKELLAICLKLAIWEKASVCIPRGGEIERTLLDRAMYLIGLHDGPSNLKTSMGANDTALLWMIFGLTATAYMFQRSTMPAWTLHLRSITKLATPRAIQKALEAWPSSSWWWTSAVHQICDTLGPTKGRWKAMGTDKDPVPEFIDGHRLKLIVLD